MDKWSSVMYETLHGLHSYTLTSGAPALTLANIVRATLIGREQLGHFGNRGFILKTHAILPLRDNALSHAKVPMF